MGAHYEQVVTHYQPSRQFCQYLVPRQVAYAIREQWKKAGLKCVGVPELMRLSQYPDRRHAVAKPPVPLFRGVRFPREGFRKGGFSPRRRPARLHGERLSIFRKRELLLEDDAQPAGIT